MRLRRSFRLAGIFIIFTAFYLLSTSINVSAQCTPGSRFGGGGGFPTTNPNAPWVGGWVPFSIWPSGPGTKPAGLPYADVSWSGLYICGYSNSAG